MAQHYASQNTTLPHDLYSFMDYKPPEGRTLICCIPNQTALNNEDVYWLLEINLLGGRLQHCFNSVAQRYKQAPSFLCFFLSAFILRWAPVLVIQCLLGASRRPAFLSMCRERMKAQIVSPSTIRQSPGLPTEWMI